MEEIENKEFDIPQPQEDNSAIVSKPGGVNNPTPATSSSRPEAPASSDGPTASTDTDAQPVNTAQSAGGDSSGSDRKIKTLQDFLDQMEQPETAEQRKKRERMEKSAKIVSAISDGIQAISNLFFTSQYAPDMYNHEKGSGLNAQSAAIEKAKKDREANADRYLKFALALGDAENERAKTVREAEADQERRKLAREKAEREREAHGWAAALQSDKQREQAEKANKAAEDARTAKAEADNAPAMQQAKLATENAHAESYRASAQNSRANAASHGRANRQYFDVEDADGNIVRVDMKDLNDYYDQSDAGIRERHRQTDSYGMVKTPTTEQMKQVVTEHLRTKGNTYRRGFDKEKYKRGGSQKKGQTPPPLN